VIKFQKMSSISRSWNPSELIFMDLGVLSSSLKERSC